ncbi:cylicin-1 [Trichogramma pretiosum]|uniref:cylicin-1 n=1 Tax=Trichogramma pretiosum TaxID=7493 RepID=UPI0006C96267|nr:cylicin-1 [Trichogramma pretiosum]
MADTETKETKVVSSPEKKVLDDEKEVPVKESPVKEAPAKVVEEVDEDSKEASENGNGKEAKENGSSEEKDVDEKELESTNGDSTDANNDTCCIKRKSMGDAVDGDAKEVTSPKKAKLDDAPVVAAVEAETNGDA